MNLLINKFPHRESGWSSEEKNLRGGIHRKKTSEGGSLGKNPSRDRPIFAPCVLSRPARMHLNSHQWDHLHIASHHHFQLFYFQIRLHQVFCVTLTWWTLTRFPAWSHLVTPGSRYTSVSWNTDTDRRWHFGTKWWQKRDDGLIGGLVAPTSWSCGMSTNLGTSYF